MSNHKEAKWGNCGQYGGNPARRKAQMFILSTQAHWVHVQRASPCLGAEEMTSFFPRAAGVSPTPHESRTRCIPRGREPKVILSGAKDL
jgi:hypothetical protein